MRALLPTLLLCPMAMAGDTGKLQILYTAYLDVQGLFPNTLAACARAAPASVAPLQQQYAQWQREHGVHQQELQQLIRQLLQQAQPDKADEAIASLRESAAKELAPLHFPQNYSFKDDYFCTRLLPLDFKGTEGGLDLQFGKYVQEMKADLAKQSAPAP
ncbi:hypothetical protein [Vogesella sp. LIG4]|uniref:hypothetical protein n=1 Tax=Vogesella sp. LIG4 TaxID=1192162 RepID=UPI00081FF04F|nr:hypothetical protein [Vogesella sp. LIG4]SCK23138.1 hypothetical protein PSELUDRAFT_2689 [Vogesella sp. LIG4]